VGNNPVEVVDTFSRRDIHSITGAAAPQGDVSIWLSPLVPSVSLSFPSVPLATNSLLSSATCRVPHCGCMHPRTEAAS
jgi:hypothetical protein